MRAFTKRCACGRTYDETTWFNLPCKGIMDLGEGDRFEIRNCACKSTIAIHVDDLVLTREDEEVLNEAQCVANEGLAFQ